MKTSRKILIAVAGLILVTFFIAILLLRNDVQSLVQKDVLKYKYQSVNVNDFEKLYFSSHWIVRIRPGKTCKVESTAGENAFLKPTMENINGTLYFKIDTTAAKENTDSIYVRITMPSLKEIKAVNGTTIQIENFQVDSLCVMLENGCVFKGINNTIKHTSFKTSGENQLDITKTL